MHCGVFCHEGITIAGSGQSMREMRTSLAGMRPSATALKEWPKTGREGKGRAVSLPASWAIAQLGDDSEDEFAGFDPSYFFCVIKTLSIFR